MINVLFLHAGAEMYGADKVMLDLIKRLDNKKFRPYVILPSNGVLCDALREAGVKVDIIPYPIMRRKYFTLPGIVSYFYNLFRYSNEIVNRTKKEHIDLIHTNTAATLEGSIVSRRLHIPQLWSIHEIIVHPKLMYKFTSKLISRYSNITITDSIAVKTHLDNSGYFKPSAVKVIYNGVDSERFSPSNDSEYLRTEWNIPANALVVGMMGRVNSWKGQMDFLNAANILLAKNDNLYCVFVGSAFEGEEWREENLQTAINNSPYSDRIINKGYRADSEGIYNLYDVFVLPSTNPDPLPTVVLEAMASGKPVVGYRHGGVCEMVQDGYNGLLANVNDPSDLADKINTLLKDDSLRHEMGLRSRKRLINKFSIQSYVDNYSKEYERLVKVKP